MSVSFDWTCLPGRMTLSAFAGCGAACFCHPFDVVRVQMQVAKAGASQSVGGTIKTIAARDGMRGFYNGISAAFLRQWMYGSGRMGIYSYLINNHKKRNAGEAPRLVSKLGMGTVAGGVGALFGTPSEVALVRMGADNQLPVEQRRNYKHSIDCVTRIFREEGMQGLFKGADVTVLRAMALGSFQMGFYSETKEYLLRMNSPWFSPTGILTMVTSATVASFVANCASLPFDVVKSRIQNMPVPEAGQPPLYTGMLDCARRSIANEGVTVLWKGFTPAFVKLAPYTVLSLTFLEWITISATGKAAL